MSSLQRKSAYGIMRIMKRQQKYLIRWARSKKSLAKCFPSMADNSWLLFGTNYRSEKSAIAITVFDTEEEAKKAIAHEKALLKCERQQYVSDMKKLKELGMLHRYEGLEYFIMSCTNQLAIGNRPVFDIVPIDAEKWEELTRSATQP